MILQALYNYYSNKQSQDSGSIAPLGMEYKNIPFIVVIDADGNFMRLEDTRSKANRNKGEPYLVAQSKVRSGKNSFEHANIFWDHKGYVLACPKDETEKAVNDAIKQHLTFVGVVTELAETFPENREFKAVLDFFMNPINLETIKGETVQNIQACSQPITEINGVFEHINKKAGANLSFKLVGNASIVASHPDISTYLSIKQTRPQKTHELSNNNEATLGRLAKEGSKKTESDVGVCLVTGLKATIARLHNPVGTYLGAQASAPLISFQPNSGYDSYGKIQGMNAPISETASFAITTALVDLLRSGRETNYKIGDVKLLFWNANYNKDVIQAYKIATFDTIPENFQKNNHSETIGRRKNEVEKIEDSSYKVYDALKAIVGHKDGYIDRLSKDRFYLLGLTPNIGRIAVKIWQEGTVEDFVTNTIQHLNDMNIVSDNGVVEDRHPPFRNLYSIVNAVSIGEQDKWSSNLIQAIIRSIISGLPYPRTLQLACLERTFQERRLTTLRAAILKAYLNRTNKSYQITMALDNTNTNKAYLCGRLFAVLEKIQNEAIESANAPIRDRFFRAAGSSPATVFGRLIALSSHHLSKIRKEKPGLAFWFDQQMESIFELFPGEDQRFPNHFNLDEQSLFAVGYYHQRVFRSSKSEDLDVE